MFPSKLHLLEYRKLLVDTWLEILNDTAKPLRYDSYEYNRSCLHFTPQAAGNKSLREIQQGVKIYQANLPEPHADTSWAMLFLADAYIGLKDYKKAEEINKKGVVIHEQLFEQDNIVMAEAQWHQGNLYRCLKDFQKAKSFFEKGLATRERIFGKNHVETARILKDLGLVYLAEGNLVKAEGFLLNALSVFQQQKHPDMYLCSESMADLFLRKFIVEKNKNFKEQAINYLKQAIEQVHENFPKNSPHLKRLKSKLDKRCA